MITFFLYVIATIGLTNIIVHGKIMDVLGIRPRLKRYFSKKAYEFFECYECIGFWAGLLMGLVVVSFNPFLFIPCAFGGACLGHFYVEVINYLRSVTLLPLGDDEPDERT